MTSDNTTSGERRFTVAICGGGIAGLTLAAVIGRHDRNARIDVRVYESATQISTVGAGIGMSYRTWKILDDLGIDIVGKQAAPPKAGQHLAMRLRRADVAEGGFDFYDLLSPREMSGMHRANLIDGILRSLPVGYRVETSKRLVAYAAPPADSSAPVMLHFADGTTARADVLVGADGVKSRARFQMYEDLADAVSDPGLLRHKEPTWSGLRAFRSLVSAQALLDAYPDHPITKSSMMYCGKHKCLIGYPLSATLVNVAAYVSEPDKEGTSFPGPWEAPSSKEEVEGLYAGWEDELLVILKNMDKCQMWAVNVVNALPHFAHGRVALIGDAAHASTPYLGSGAGQGIEDAFILGRLLSHPSTTPATLARALEVYDGVRRPIANAVVQRARDTGRLYGFDMPGTFDGERGDAAVEMERLRELGEAVSRQFAPMWEGEPEDIWEEAKRDYEELLEESVVNTECV